MKNDLRWSLVTLRLAWWLVLTLWLVCLRWGLVFLGRGLVLLGRGLISFRRRLIALRCGLVALWWWMISLLGVIPLCLGVIALGRSHRVTLVWRWMLHLVRCRLITTGNYRALQQEIREVKQGSLAYQVVNSNLRSMLQSKADVPMPVFKKFDGIGVDGRNLMRFMFAQIPSDFSFPLPNWSHMIFVIFVQ